MSDTDFSNVLLGLTEQRSLRSLTYSRNQFGTASVGQLAKLVQAQRRFNKKSGKDSLHIVKITNVKIDREVLMELVTEVLLGMDTLTQLKLTGVDMNYQDVVT